MKTTNRIAITASSAALLTIGVGVLTGCGSGGKVDALSGAALSKSQTGKITLAIAWPARTTTNTRVIPTATTGIQLVIVSQTGIFTSTGTNTYTVPSIPYGTASITISNIPAGSAIITASAVLQQASGPNIVLAGTAPTTINVGAGQNNSVTLTLTATLNTSTTAVSTTIQKVLNSDGSTVSPTDPTGLPQSISATNFNSPYTNLQDGAVYEVISSLSSAGSSSTISLPAANEFNFDIENDYDLKGATTPFFTAVDSKGNALAVRPATGTVAYFKVALAGEDGELYVPLNATQFSDPNSNSAPYGVYYLAAPGFIP